MAASPLGLVLSRNAPAALDVIIGRADDAQPPLPLASDGVLRWVWRGRYGEMLIEVAGDEVFVNGARVSRHRQERPDHAP